MNLTEKQAIELTRKVLKDIKFKYHEDQPVKAAYTEDPLLTGKQIKKAWTGMCRWFDPDYLDGMEKSAFLKIDDETGEPVFFNRRSGGMGTDVIAKDDKGNYYVKSTY